MKTFPKLIGLCSVILFLLSPVFVQAEEHQPSISPDEALARLIEGNKRFVEGKNTHPDIQKSRLKETAEKGQHPFATILACSDSRVPVEILFDQGIGDLFVVRVAGNTSGGDEMGSIEYCVDHLGSPLLIVLGHTKCGAVTAAASHAHTGGNLIGLIERIAPAVDRVQKAHPEKKTEEMVPEIIDQNVWLAIETILSQSEELRDKVQKEELKIVAAIYDIETGKVDFKGIHPKQDRFFSKKPISVLPSTSIPQTTQPIQTPQLAP